MRLFTEEAQSPLKLMCGTLCHQRKSSCATSDGVNNKSMVNKPPLNNNGSNRILVLGCDSSWNRDDVHEDNIIITCFWDREREQQLSVVTTNTHDNHMNNNVQSMDNKNSTSGRKFNYDHPKVQPESQCQRTMEVYEMLLRPFSVGRSQHLRNIPTKYQPRSQLRATVLSQSAVKLHFNLTFLILLILLAVISPSKANPARGRGEETEGDSSPKRFNSMEYLAYYGYVPLSYLETGDLRSTNVPDKNIQAFQEFANLPVTGQLDAATEAKLKQPRCGVPDKFHSDDRTHRHDHGSHRRNRRYLAGPSKWDKHILTYRIKVFSPQLEQHHVTSRIRKAFSVWSRWVKLDFRQVYSGHADMFILFARGNHYDGYPFDGPGLILAHAFFPGEDRGGDIHFDEDETWKIDSSGTDFFSVAVHEIGHALGLAHSSVPGSLMYPWYQGYDPDFELHRDDIEGIQKLYEPRDGRHLPNEPTYVPPHPGTNKPTVYIPPREDPDPTPKAPVRPTPVPTPSGNQPPDPCTTTFDAITIYRNEIFMFKGKWFWRLGKEGIPENYPVHIHRFFLGLPKDIDSFDAAYERPEKGRLVAFKGDRYWVFDGNKLVPSMSSEGRPITDFGFPASLKKIDAAFIWNYNHKTYFIAGDMYWKYFEDSERMAHNYPRDMKIWGGVKVPVDTAFKDKNGTTYFFHKRHYYEFHDELMKVRRGPKNLNRDWLQCKHVVKGEDEDEGKTDRQGSDDSVESSGISMLFGTHHGRIHVWCIGLLIILLSKSSLL